ncbi:MAG: PAS domain S-box protein, partial [Acidobacteria bacterium]
MESMESVALRAALFEAVSDGILLLEGLLCRLIGYTEDELLGQSARILYTTDEEFERVGQEKYAQIHASGRGTVETRWRRKDGVVLDILLSSSPLDPDDWAKGVTFTALDITVRKQTEAALRARTDQL